MTQHTPGPWHVDEAGYGKEFGIRDDYDRQIGTVEPANARLIAAAPDLLAALRNALGALKDARDHTIHVRHDPIEMADAAIAKAEGRA